MNLLAAQHWTTIIRVGWLRMSSKSLQTVTKPMFYGGSHPDDTRMILHLWTVALFKSKSHCAWTLYQERGVVNAINVRRMRPHNLYGIQNIMEATVSDYRPDQIKLNRLLDEGCKLQIPVLVRPRLGKDGWSSGIVLPSSAPMPTPTTINWWASGPPEYDQLNKWFRRITRFLKRT